MKTPVIFLIDDDEDDQEMFLEAVGDVNPSALCHTANTAEEALAALKNEGARLPDFIFLDINMPGIGGKECLTELKKINKLAHIPIIIYTTSKEKKDKEETRNLGASGFFTKPAFFDEIRKALKYILDGKWVEKLSFDIGSR